MLRKKLKVTRIAAIVLALLMLASVFNVPLLPNVNLNVSAAAGGKSSPGGPGGAAIGNYVLDGGNFGYRIYFAKSQLSQDGIGVAITDEGLNVPGVESGKLTGLDKLREYLGDGDKNFALYHLWGNYAQKEQRAYLANGTEMFVSNANGMDGTQKVVTRNGVDADDIFHELGLPSEKSVNGFSSGYLATDFTHDKEIFNDWINGEGFNIDDFITNYKTILGEDVYASAGLPDSGNEFNGEWAIVVEPLLLTKYDTGRNLVSYCVGFYDFFAPTEYSYSSADLQISKYITGTHTMSSDWSAHNKGLRGNPLAKNLSAQGAEWVKKIGNDFWGIPITGIDNSQYDTEGTIYAGWAYYTANGQAGSKSKANVSITHKQTATGSEEVGRSVTFWRNAEEEEVIEPLKSAIKGFADASVEYTDENTNINLNVVRSSAEAAKDYNSGRDLEISLADLPENMAGVNETDGEIKGTDGYTLAETYYVQGKLKEGVQLNADELYSNLEDMNITQFTSAKQVVVPPPGVLYSNGFTFTTVASKEYADIPIGEAGGYLKYEIAQVLNGTGADFTGLKVVEGAAINKTRSHYSDPKIINNIVTNGATYGLASSGMQDISIPELRADGAGTFGFEFNLLTEKSQVESGLVFVKLYRENGKYLKGEIEKRGPEKNYDISETWQTTSEKNVTHSIIMYPNTLANQKIWWDGDRVNSSIDSEIILYAQKSYDLEKNKPTTPQDIIVGTDIDTADDNKYVGYTILVATVVDTHNLTTAEMHLKEYELGHFYPDLNAVSKTAADFEQAKYIKVNASGYNWDNGGDTLVTDTEQFTKYSSGIDWLERAFAGNSQSARNLFGAADGKFITNIGGHSVSRWRTYLGAGVENTFNIKANLTRGALQDMFNLSTIEYGSSRAFENLGLGNSLTGTGYSGEPGKSVVSANAKDGFKFTSEETWHKLTKAVGRGGLGGNQFTETQSTVTLYVAEEQIAQFTGSEAYVKDSLKYFETESETDPLSPDYGKKFYSIKMYNNDLGGLLHPSSAEQTGYYKHQVIWKDTTSTYVDNAVYNQYAENKKGWEYGKTYVPAVEAVQISYNEMIGKDGVLGTDDDVSVWMRKYSAPRTINIGTVEEPIPYTTEAEDDYISYDPERPDSDYSGYSGYYTRKYEPGKWVTDSSSTPIGVIDYVKCYHYNTKVLTDDGSEYVWLTNANSTPFGYETVTESSQRYFANDRGIGTSSETSSLLETERNIGTWGYGSLWYRNYTDNDTVEGLFTTKDGTEITDTDKKYLTFWPEVEMLASNHIDAYGRANSWLPGLGSNADGDGRNDPDPYAGYYVMGELAREATPSALYSIRLMDAAAKNIATDKDLSGKFSSSTIANQTVAIVTGGKKDLPVVYAGGDINAKIEQNYTVVLNGFVLDLDEKRNPKSGGEYNLKTAWNNDTIFNTAKDFEQWSEQIAEGFTYDVGLDIVKNNSEKTIEYVGLQAQTGKSTIKSNAVAKEKYLVKIKNGEAVWDSETVPLLRRLKAVYGCTEDEAKELIKKSGMLEALAKSVESSIDGDNKSAKDDDLGLGNGEHWYDEQVRSFVIKEYETVIEMPEILVNDKIDYNAGPKQNGALFSNGYRVDWKLSVTLANRTAEPLFGRAKTELLIDKTIDKASFIVADATTSDMRR